MSTSGKFQNPQKNPVNDPTGATAASGPNDERIPVNGFNQILEMLKVADPAFRESLLRRIAVKDRNLAETLRQDLAYLGL